MVDAPYVTVAPELLKRLNTSGTLTAVIKALPFNCSAVIGEGEKAKIVPASPEMIGILKLTEVLASAPLVLTHQEM